MLVKDEVKLPNNFKFDMFITSGAKYSSDELHIHDCLEMNFVLEGTGINIIGEKEYQMKEGDIYIINNLEYHHAFSNNYLKLLVIVFDQIFIDSYTNDFLNIFYKNHLVFNHLINENNSHYNEIKILILEMIKEWDKKEHGYDLFIISNLLKILALLNRYGVGEKELENITSDSNSINKVIKYIRFNFKDHITLTQLAEVANLNKSYLSTLFKKTMNLSIFEYIKDIRLAYSNYLIKNTSLTITEVSMQSGFKNLSHFVKCYREKYNITPNRERKQLNR